MWYTPTPWPCVPPTASMPGTAAGRGNRVGGGSWGGGGMTGMRRGGGANDTDLGMTSRTPLSELIWPTNVPSELNTWMRRLSRSATAIRMPSVEYATSEILSPNWPAPDPCSPNANAGVWLPAWNTWMRLWPLSATATHSPSGE